jgi:hypothetical protein
MGDHAEKSKLPSFRAIRLWLYGVGVASAPLLIAYGILEADTVPMWVSWFGVFLGVTNGIAFAKVSD